MSQPNRRIVAPDGEKGDWTASKPGAERASARFPTQAEAIDRAREILKKDGGGELQIRNRQGQIRDSDAVPPGHDPDPPRDKR